MLILFMYFKVIEHLKDQGSTFTANYKDLFDKVSGALLWFIFIYFIVQSGLD